MVRGHDSRVHLALCWAGAGFILLEHSLGVASSSAKRAFTAAVITSLTVRATRGSSKGRGVSGGRRPPGEPHQIQGQIQGAVASEGWYPFIEPVDALAGVFE